MSIASSPESTAGLTFAAPKSAKSAAAFLPALTGLRFFAALHVIGHHLRSCRMIDVRAWPEVDRFFQRAGASVGLFFILSGFILAYGYFSRRAGGTHSWATFYRVRFARVYPVYLFGLLLTAPLFLAERRYLGGGLASSETFLFGGLVLTLLQAWFPVIALAWNVPGWSLSVEAFFYLLFPVAVVAVSAWSRRGVLIGMAACWLVVSELALIVAMNATAICETTGWSIERLAAVMKYDPFVRLPEFLFGVLLGKLFTMRGETSGDVLSRITGTWALATAALFVGILACCPLRSLDLPLHNGLLIPIVGLLLWQLALGGSGFAKFLSHPTLLLLGQSSYALYIVHTPIIQYARGIFGDLRRTPTLSSGVAIGVTMASIILAVLVRTFLEEPMRKRLLGRRASRPATAAAATQESATSATTHQEAASLELVGAR